MNDRSAINRSGAQSNSASMILLSASVVAFVQYAAHSFLFLSAIKNHPSSAMAAIAASQRHSYWDLYVGYGWLAILSGVIETVLLWQLALLAKRNIGSIRPTVILLICANGAHAWLVWSYFSLLPPVVFDLVIAGLLLFSVATLPPRRVESPVNMPAHST